MINNTLMVIICSQHVDRDLSTVVDCSSGDFSSGLTGAFEALYANCGLQ